MAGLCERLSRRVVQRLCGMACSTALRGRQRLPFLTRHLGSAKVGGAGLDSCEVPPARTMVPIIGPFVSEAAVIIDLAYMG
jgi:hypothetical protein